jgi:hypothetical protein
VQVLAAAHGLAVPPQVIWQAAPGPQARLHDVEPEQSTLHAPWGQLTMQPLFPLQLTLPPGPIVSAHVLVPSHVTVLLPPATRLQVLPPPHVEVQDAPHAPAHDDCPSQLVVQPLPQSTEHMFFELHW